MEEAKWGPNLFADIIHSSLFYSHSAFSLLWSPPVPFSFFLWLSFSFLSPAFPSLGLRVSVSCLSSSVLWARGVRSSWVHLGGEREKKWVRKGKSVRTRRCERGRWEKGAAEGEGEIIQRKTGGWGGGGEKDSEVMTWMSDRTRRRQKKVNDCSHKWEIAAKVSVRKSLKNVIGLQKYGSQLCKWCGTQVSHYRGYFLNPRIFFLRASNSKSQY